MYKNSSSKIVPVISDNCAASQTVARQMSCQFIGCTSHLFDFAVKGIIAKHRPFIDDIKTIIIQFCISVHGANLKEWTDLASVKCSKTRWSPVKVILEGYIEV